MKIVINNLITLKDTPREYYFRSVEGLDTPEYRDFMYLNSGSNGGRFPKQLYGHRIFNIEGGIEGADCDDFVEKRKAFFEALSFDEFVPLSFYMDNGQILTSFVKFRKPIMNYSEKMFADFQLTAVSERYYMVDTSTGGTNLIEVNVMAENGWDLTDGWLLDTGWTIHPSQEGVNAVNAGNLEAEPVIWIKGETQNPTIKNLTTGKQITVNVTTSASDEIKIDTRLKATLLNGGNINALVTGDYFTLAPGDNIITFESGLGDGYAEVEWYNTYV